MSEFIVPISGLPSIASITEQQKGGGAARALENVPFASILQDAVANLETTGELSKQAAYDLAVGNSDDLHTGAIAAVKYNTAVSFASGLASSVVRAYNELMRMSI